MIEPPKFVDAMLGLPLPVLGLLVVGVWALIAVLVHRVLVPWIAWRNGHSIGRFEAEVASQLGIVLGLLLSFNAVTVWEQSGAARDATIAEASALREVYELAPELPPDQQVEVRDALRSYVDYVIHDEWPRLGRGPLTLEKPASLRALARLGRASGNDDLHDAISAAAKARDERIRIATSRMLPARWGIVIFLGILSLLAIGLVHAENRRARAFAIGMVGFAIASCFIVLMVQARPFLGSLALRPTELSAITRELGSSSVARADAHPSRDR